MSYNVVNPVTGEVTKRYTLKEKYEYYKKKANQANGKNKQGKPISFTGRVALANRANSINRKMGKNKKRYDFYKGK